MFKLELLQAISDWQIGSNESRTRNLKKACLELPSEYRTCLLVSYRQVALPKGGVWKLIGENRLPEKVSSWTVDLDVAKAFKGGVPPEGQGFQGTILCLYPSAAQVIVNLWKLYQDPEFVAALYSNKSAISRYGDGAGRYGNTQAEIVLEVDTVTQEDIYSLGGHSSAFEQLVNEAANYVYGTNGSPASPAQREALLLRAEHLRAEAGPRWLTPEATKRVLAKTKPQAEVLVAVKQIQDAKKSGEH